MVQLQGLCVLLYLAPVLLLLYPVPCQAQTIIQFWYADISDAIDSSKADVKFPSGNYGTLTPDSPGAVPDATVYTNIIRGSSKPPGTNVESISWSSPEADKAKNAAQKCDSSPGNGNEIVVGSTTPMSYAEALHKIRTDCKDLNDLCSKPCLQYSMLLASGLNKIGCARAHCPDTALPHRVHCVLEPKSALTASSCSKPYDTDGQPCEKCPRNKGYCYNNLCVSHTDKTEILRNTPTAVITCSAPCRNCGVRKDFKNECFCQCEAGTSGPSCQQGSTTATCGKCAHEGRPCLNNGIDAGESTCRCLCHHDFVGPRCEFPRHQAGGGTRVIITGRPSPPCEGKDCKIMTPSIGEVTGPILNDIKKALADQVNQFCKKDQTNYAKCCGGTGSLPTSGATDFVTPDNVKIPASLIGYTSDGAVDAPIHVTAPGNNGLCRKKVRDSTMHVPIPDDVLKAVIENTLNPCCSGVRVNYGPPVAIPGITNSINVMTVTIS